MTNERSTLYGLTIASELRLPNIELAPPEVADIVVRREAIDPAGMTADERGRMIRASGEEIVIYWPQVGRYLIRGGREIVIDPDPGIEDSVLALYVLGTGLGLLLHQRGFITVHASAISIEGRAAIFIGEKGWGKSSLAAALIARGHKLLNDDIAAIRRLPAAISGSASESVPGAHGDAHGDAHGAGELYVIPGSPHVKLWPDALKAALGQSAEAHERLYPEVEKRGLHLDGAFCPEPTPLRAVYCLAGGERLEIVPLSKTDGVMGLLAHWYGARFGMPVLSALGVATYFQQCVEVAKQSHCALLRRPPNMDSIAASADMVVQDVLGLK